MPMLLLAVKVVSNIKLRILHISRIFWVNMLCKCRDGKYNVIKYVKRSATNLTFNVRTSSGASNIKVITFSLRKEVAFNSLLSFSVMLLLKCKKQTFLPTLVFGI